MKKSAILRAWAISAAAIVGGGVGATAMGSASASACTHTAVYGNVNVRTAASTGAGIITTLIAPSGSVTGDCGAEPGGAYSCFGVNGTRWYRVYTSPFGYVASGCVQTT